ncbi:TPA: hypothetical protein J1X47_002866 [Escherichia coli]|nr:hypothetical protein [Escherichia coli]
MSGRTTPEPLGAASAKVLYTNAGNLDRASNDREYEWWTDRFGVLRRTW